MKTEKPLTPEEVMTIQDKLFEKTGHRLIYYIEQAFTRRSYSRRYGGGNNENLEFIGDAVIGYYVIRQLYDYYSSLNSNKHESIYNYRANENDFSVLKSRIVSNHNLSCIMDEWGLGDFLIVGQSDIEKKGEEKEKINADLFEAIIGAYAVQYQWDQDILEEIVSRALPVRRFIIDYERQQNKPPVFNALNAVITLKELAEHEECSLPVYEIKGPEKPGYTDSGEHVWYCSCTVANYGIRKEVYANTKKDAKKFAAYLVLCDIFDLPNGYGPNVQRRVWYYDDGKLIPEE
ncbi:MAG: hypothetical protein J5850_00870 [Clostridia bacterium]|nr:hypothetical protein [Clostridia bacterium]